MATKVYKDDDEGRRHYQMAIDGPRRLGRDDVADEIEAEGYEGWLERTGRSIKAENPRQRANADRPDADHPVEVRRHWRTGGASQWQRAAKAGQHDLFAHGIKVKNPADAQRVLEAFGFSRAESRELIAKLKTRHQPPKQRSRVMATKQELQDQVDELQDVIDERDQQISDFLDSVAEIFDVEITENGAEEDEDTEDSDELEEAA